MAGNTNHRRSPPSRLDSEPVPAASSAPRVPPLRAATGAPLREPSLLANPQAILSLQRSAGNRTTRAVLAGLSQSSGATARQGEASLRGPRPPLAAGHPVAKDAHVPPPSEMPGLQGSGRSGSGKSELLQRFFPPPDFGPKPFPSAAGISPNARVTKTKTKKGAQQPTSKPEIKQGWSIDKETTTASELDNNGAASAGDKTTRLTAFLTPNHAKLNLGGPTQMGYDPIGWKWIVTNEVRSAKRARITHWVRFHLLNADIGGKGYHVLHLIPADQSANSKWKTQIETDMKTALNTYPIYYDVRITYYSIAEAPGTYGPPNAAIDYRPNIQLFPKTIQAEWQIFDSNKWQWVSKGITTVMSGVPAAPGQRETELIGAQNLRMLASVYQVDEDILRLLQQANGTFAKYGQVRRRLEQWGSASSSPTQYEARMDRIAASEPYLRDALTGAGNRKLKINGAFVLDDNTPEAKYYDSPARVKKGGDLLRFKKVTPAIQSGYHYAAVQEQPPSSKTFFHHYLRSGPTGKATLAQLQQEWDIFVAANDALPPLRDTDFAPDGEEIPTIVLIDFMESLPLAAEKIYTCDRELAASVRSLRDQVATYVPDFVKNNLGRLNFTAYGSQDESWKALTTDPVAQPWLSEMAYRIEWYKHLEGRALLNQSPLEFLNAPINDAAPLRRARVWYDQWKLQSIAPALNVASPLNVPSTGLGQKTNQFSQFNVFSAPTNVSSTGPGQGSGGFTQTSGLTGDSDSTPMDVDRGQSGRGSGARHSSYGERNPEGNARYSRPAIDPRNAKVIDRIKRECINLGTPISERRYKDVLAAWAKPTYQGYGDIDQDVQKAMRYIQHQ
jgi:hypothetical protein